jgi:hypothetical protein
LVTYASEKYARQALEIVEGRLQRMKVNNNIPRKERNEEIAKMIYRKNLINDVLKKRETGEIA